MWCKLFYAVPCTRQIIRISVANSDRLRSIDMLVSACMLIVLSIHVVIRSEVQHICGGSIL